MSEHSSDHRDPDFEMPDSDEVEALEEKQEVSYSEILQTSVFRLQQKDEFVVFSDNMCHHFNKQNQLTAQVKVKFDFSCSNPEGYPVLKLGNRQIGLCQQSVYEVQIDKIVEIKKLKQEVGPFYGMHNGKIVFQDLITMGFRELQDNLDVKKWLLLDAFKLKEQCYFAVFKQKILIFLRFANKYYELGDQAAEKKLVKPGFSLMLKRIHSEFLYFDIDAQQYEWDGNDFRKAAK